MNPSIQDDATLLQEFVRTGSQPAFRILTERYSGLVFSAAWRRTGQRSLAEEVAQNVFAVLARKASALVGPEVKLAAWLHRATVLEAARAWRRESNRQRIMHQYTQHAETMAADDAGTAWQMVLPELDAALDALPARDRELLMARFFEDRSYGDLARVTGRSEGALMQHQHRALEKLGINLRRRGVVFPASSLASGLAGTLSQAAPSGLAASLAVSAPAAASSIPHGLLLWHTLDTLMHTKSYLTLTAALVAAALCGGSVAFFTGKSRAEARGHALIAAAESRHSADSTLPHSVVSAARSRTEVAALPYGVRAKLEQAAHGWRANSDYALRMNALEVLDGLSPDEVATAQTWLTSIKAEDGLHLALAKRIAVLWGKSEPGPALQWLTGELPREHRGDPMQAILEGWSRRDPKAALAWWEGVRDSLNYPIPENAFERFETLIYSGWAVQDAASLAATLPQWEHPRNIEENEGSPGHAQMMALATAAADPRTRAPALAAIAGIASDGTKAAAASLTAMMMNGSDAAAGRDFLLSLEFSDAAIRRGVLGPAAMMGVMMQQQAPAEAVAWLRQHTDEATTRKVVEDFVSEHGGGDLAEIAAQLSESLDKP